LILAILKYLDESGDFKIPNTLNEIKESAGGDKIERFYNTILCLIAEGWKVTFQDENDEITFVGR